MMPVMDGIATKDALRKLPEISATPMVFFTANAQREVEQDLLLRGALGVIVKPIEPDALVEQIRTLWRRFAPATAP